MNLKTNSQKWATWGFYALLPIAAVSFSSNTYAAEARGGHGARADAKVQSAAERQRQNARHSIDHNYQLGVKDTGEEEPLAALDQAHAILKSLAEKGLESPRVSYLEEQLQEAEAKLAELSKEKSSPGADEEVIAQKQSALDEQLALLREKIQEMTDLNSLYTKDGEVYDAAKAAEKTQLLAVEKAKAQVALVEAEKSGNAKAIKTAEARLFEINVEIKDIDKQIEEAETAILAQAQIKKAALRPHNIKVADLRRKLADRQKERDSAVELTKKANARAAKEKEAFLADISSPSLRAKAAEDWDASEEKTKAQRHADALLANEESSLADTQAALNKAENQHRKVALKNSSTKTTRFLAPDWGSGKLNELNQLRIDRAEALKSTYTAEQMSPDAKIARIRAKLESQGKQLSASREAKLRSILEKSAPAESSKAQRDIASAKGATSGIDSRLQEAKDALARAEAHYESKQGKTVEAASALKARQEELGAKKKKGWFNW